MRLLAVGDEIRSLVENLPAGLAAVDLEVVGMVIRQFSHNNHYISDKNHSTSILNPTFAHLWSLGSLSEYFPKVVFLGQILAARVWG